MAKFDFDITRTSREYDCPPPPKHECSCHKSGSGELDGFWGCCVGVIFIGGVILSIGTGMWGPAILGWIICIVIAGIVEAVKGK